MSKSPELKDLYTAPFLRHCSVKSVAEPDVEELRRAILAEEEIESGFSILEAPLPPLDQTRFRWAGNEQTLLLGVAFPHSQHLHSEPDGMDAEGLELFFDLYHDGLGYQQLIFESNGSYQEATHLPYIEAHSSSFPLLKPIKWECQVGNAQESLGGMRYRWFWVWFKTADIFSRGESVGFNAFRSRVGGEFSGWNFPAGNGAPDATAFGVLHRTADSLAKVAVEKAVTCIKTEPHPASDFTLSATYDSPDNLIFAYLTPERIGEEVQLLKKWGIKRLHWIDYSDFPAMWHYPGWRENAAKSHQACGELMPCAARQAREQGMEFIVDFKVFDYGFHYPGFVVEEGVPGGIPGLEGDYITSIPETAAHQEWTFQANPAWRNQNSGPVATLRFFSDEPIREVIPEEVTLLVSDDNRDYLPYPGSFNVRQSVVLRPHERWTPAGNARDEGEVQNWVIELSGLNLNAAYAAVQIAGEEVALWQRGFMVMEAENAEGKRLPHTLATSGGSTGSPARHGFWYDWPGWANITEPLLQRRRWSAKNLGFALREMPNMPTLLEPTYEGARQIWLDRIARIFDGGADGVNMRIFNHHNGVMNYLQFAFAPAVIDEFRSRFGREPETTPEDYERVRRLRGEAFTQFMRDARKLADARGKKLMTQLESGIEVPPHLDTRMQLHIDWQTWLRERLVDEVSLKFWTSYSRFIHEQVMPLAREMGVPVHVVSRNLSGIILSPRAHESIPRQIEDARKLGFAGFNYYEAADLYERNSAGGIWTKGLAEAALERTRDELAAAPEN